MNEYDYKPNSNKYKTDQKEEKKVEKVVKGSVKTRKKSGVRKAADSIISEDVQNVKSYILMDVLIPAIKKAVVDIVTDGINMIIYGDTRPRGSSRTSKIAYTDYSRDDRRSINYNRTRNGYSYDDIILETRGEAEEVIDRMNELIVMYGTVSVADLYDLVGKSCQYTDNKYGWKNIRNAEPVRVSDGFMLKLPRALPID